MISKVRDKLRCKNGDISIITIALAVLILALGLFISDFLRVYTLQENISDELYRGANLAIKTAMYDSHRQSGVSKYDVDLAEDAFYSYLYDDMGLNRSFEKKKADGGVEYSLSDLEIVMVSGGAGSTPRLSVEAVIHTTPVYFGQFFDYEFPVKVKSRNMRVD